MSGPPEREFAALSITEWARIPFRERVADQLADLLFKADDILQMLDADPAANEIRWVEPDVRKVYDNVNALMKALCD